MPTSWIDVSDVAPRIAYTATASQTLFAVPFVFFEDEDLKVFQNDVQITLTTDYTVVGAEDEDGGSITLLTGATVGDSIVITRDVPIEQTTHIPPSGPLDIPAVNVQFSKLIAIDQQLDDKIDRSIHFPESEATIDAELAPVATRASKLMGFDSDGAIIYPSGPTFVGDTATGAAVVDSRATASVTTFAISVNAIITCGLATAGDGGGTTYVRGLVSDPGAFADGGGVYWKVSASAGANNSTSPQGRLTTVSGVTVPTTDQVSVQRIYYGPVSNGVGGFVPIFNSVAMQQFTFLASATDSVGLSLVLGNSWLANTAYFCFTAILTGTTVVLGTGPAWSISSGATATPGTGAGTTELELYNGVWTNKYEITLRTSNTTTIQVPAHQATMVGGFKTVAAGETEDSAKKRLLWNAYNQTGRPLANTIETANSWTIPSGWQQANANTANQVEIFTGLSGNLLHLDVLGIASNTVGNNFMAVNISIDGVHATPIARRSGPSTTPGTGRIELNAIFDGYASIGGRAYAWTEFSDATGVTTGYGDNNSPSTTQCGIGGSIQM